MSTFRDAANREWQVELDAFMIGDLREQYKIDLSDVMSGSYVAIETDVVQLVRALSVICRDQLKQADVTPQQFAKAITGEAITRAYEAVLAGAANFFPAKTWSAIKSSCKQRREINDQLANIRPTLRLLNDPDMPEPMVDAIWMAIREWLGEFGSTDLRRLAANPSVPGQAVTPSTAVSGSLASAESPPVD